MRINESNAYPDCYNDIETGRTHESMLRSYQALKKTLQMIKQGDSAKTILEVAALWGYFPDPD